MSNAIIRQEGPGSVVADNLWDIRLGAVPLALGLLSGAAGAALVLRLVRRPARPSAPMPADWPTNIAHRGGAAIAPENTLEGFRKAQGLGDVTLELDAQTCASGEVVVIHDATVDRTTNGTGSVARATCSRLQQLDAGHRFTIDEGATHPWRGRGVRVPTLEEVYRQFPDHRVVIELKGDRPGAEEALWRTIEAAGAQHRTLVATETSSTIRRFRQVSGNTVATAASVSEFTVFWLLSLAGFYRFYRPAFQALQPPETYRGIRVLTPAIIRKAHVVGLRVDVWTINDAADMNRLLSWGVDGIMTDRPDVLATVLENS